ncbi:MAG: PIN domain-containing protein [Rhodanobacteraceae bacterium]
MTSVAVVDTNVVAAGLMTTNDDAPTARILDDMLAAAFPFAVSEPLLAEYREVLNRPALRKRHGLKQAEIESLQATLVENAIVLTPATGPIAPDPGDQHLWDLLASRDGLCLVTNDRLLLQQPSPPARVLAAVEFAEQGTLL